MLLAGRIVFQRLPGRSNREGADAASGPLQAMGYRFTAGLVRLSKFFVASARLSRKEQQDLSLNRLVAHRLPAEVFQIEHLSHRQAQAS
ncbi:hypothetical protein J2Y48_003665 [Mycoplana sp. BE70]|nr:hypothetical protein [Mycoplana sp. BE70]MDR6758366.1 hypothetical protein [Mycoplana sp. BE70]